MAIMSGYSSDATSTEAIPFWRLNFLYLNRKWKTVLPSLEYKTRIVQRLSVLYRERMEEEDGKRRRKRRKKRRRNKNKRKKIIKTKT